MEKYLKKIKPKYYWLVAFVLTAITYTMAFSYMGLLGNGKYVIARSDLKQQYIPFIQYFCSVLRGEHDYWYSWSLGMGSGTALLFAYYTLSPFNLIYLILGEDFVMTATAMVIVLKAATAAATFQIFIKNYLKKNYYETVIFSMMYALCCFQVCYYFNIMWMDAFYMLPVISLGIIKLIRERKWKLLLFSYTYVFCVNFYMGYIVGVSSFFLFLFAFFYNCRKRKLIENVGIVLMYGSSVISSFLLTAIIWLPAAIQLFQNTNKNYPSFSMSKCNILFLINNLFMGQLQTLRGITPFVYSGLLVVVLLPFFFLNKHIARKKKVYATLCLMWFICLFLIEPLNMMMHAFDKPGFFEQRFSFVFSFLLVTICCEQIVFLRQMRIKQMCLYFVCCFGMFAVSSMLYKEYWFEEYNANTVFNFGVNALFLLALFLVVIKIQSKKWDMLTFRVVLTCLVMGELLCNADLCIARMEHKPMEQDEYEIWSTWENNTYKKITENDDTEFFRIFSLNRRGQNSSFLYDYNALETFCSAEHKAVMDLLEKLGFYRGVHIIQGTGSTPITRTLFNVKYNVCGASLIYEEGENNVCLYYEKNERPLALGYMVDEGITEYVTVESPFENQDNLLSAMTGIVVNCFEKTGMKMTVESGQYVRTDEKTYLLHEENRKGNSVFKYETQKDGRPLYAYFSQDRYIDVTNGGKIPWIATNDVTNLLENTIFKPELVPARIMQIGTDENGNYNFSINVHELLEGDYYNKAYFCYYDDTEFEKAYEKLAEQQLVVSQYTDREIKGNIVVKKKNIMFTSIPYDEGWKVWVDGKEREIIPLLGNAFIGMELETGNHTIEMRYEPQGKVVGELISIVAVIMVLIATIIEKIKKKDTKNECIG